MCVWTSDLIRGIQNHTWIVKTDSVLPEAMSALIWPRLLLAVFFCFCTDGLSKKPRKALFIFSPLYYSISILKLWQPLGQALWLNQQVLLQSGWWGWQMTAKKCGFLFGQGVGFVSDYPEQEGLVGHSPHREQTRPKVNFCLVRQYQ